MATGFHGFHVIIGTIFLTVCLIRLMAGGFSPKQHFGFEAAAWYWHFVDVVWLFLFAFIYVIFGAQGGH
jgi:cytochrome c oxidase subunit III